MPWPNIAAISNKGERIKPSSEALINVAAISDSVVTNFLSEIASIR